MPKKTSKTTHNTPPIQFERALADLESLVEQMESGELSLEDSLTHFEAGIKLTRECQSALMQAEQKVQMLIQDNGKETLIDFEENDAE
jgi:exodeoxyribonuclease VII small subunit